MTTTALRASELATPPRPPFPILTRPLTPAELEDALRELPRVLLRGAPLSQADVRGEAHPAAVPGLGRQPAGVPAGGAAEGRRDPLQLPRSRRCAGSGSSASSTTTAPGRARAASSCGSGWASRSGVPREEMEDERHVLPGGADHLRVLRLVLQVEAVGAGLRVVAHRAVRAQDPPAADRVLPDALPLDPAGGARLLQEPPGPGPARRQARARHSCSSIAPRSRPSGWRSRPWQFKLEMLWSLIDVIHNAYKE